MNEQTKCELEQDVVKSVRSGFFSEAVSAHIETCVNCRETAAAASFFQQVLSNEPQPKNLPVAGFIWWRSRLHEKQKLAQRAARPMAIAQIAAVIVAFGTFIWLWQSGSFRASVFGVAVARVFTTMEQMSFTLLLGAIFFIIVCASLGFTLRRLMPDK